MTVTGPDHDSIFQVEVLAGERVLGQGSGRSKQEAQQEAARQALSRYRSTAALFSEEEA
jgi:ribonuclease-3